MEEIHGFDNTVIAIIEDGDTAEKAVSELRSAGYEVEVLQGDEGKQHLDPAGETGAVATIKRMLNVLGDQYRIIERLNAELDNGNYAISVDSEPDEATRAVEILQEHGGEFMWKLGTWTYSQIGE